MIKKNFSGQALLIVLLSMAVVLTIVLSVLSRSVSDISLSTKDEDSLRAFSAAEAGIEKALMTGLSIQSAEDLVGAKYSVEVGSYAEGQREFIYPTSLFSGESATIWFVAHDEDGNYVCNSEKPCFKGNNFRVCWGKEGVEPAIEVIVFYTTTPGDYSTTRMARMAIDPNAARRSSNNFISNGNGTCTIDSMVYPYFRYVNFESLGILNAGTTENILQFAIVRFLYNVESSSPLAISGPTGSIFPSQGSKIESSGSSANANRKIDVFKFFPETADVFQFGAFTLGSLTK